MEPLAPEHLDDSQAPHIPAQNTYSNLLFAARIVSHFASVFITSSSMEKKLVDRELEKMEDED